MSKTAISWADVTLNPFVGCTKVKKGCGKCYAELAAASPRLQQFERYRNVTTNGRWNGKVEFVPHVLDELVRMGKSKTVFMPSMSDPYHHNVKQEWLDRTFAAIALVPYITIKMLTKRPERAYEYLSDEEMPKRVFSWMQEFVRRLKLPLSRVKDEYPKFENLQLGTSVEDQGTANERIPWLLKTPVKYRFVSYEPALDRVDFERIIYDNMTIINALTGDHGVNYPLHGRGPRLHEVIMGGESGKGAEEFHCEWARLVAVHCLSANVYFHLKQLGSNPFDKGEPIKAGYKGQNTIFWPEDLMQYHTVK